MEREVGGGIRMGNTCKPMTVSFQCMTKFTTKKKKLHCNQMFSHVFKSFVIYSYCTLMLLQKCFMFKKIHREDCWTRPDCLYRPLINFRSCYQTGKEMKES